MGKVAESSAESSGRQIHRLGARLAELVGPNAEACQQTEVEVRELNNGLLMSLANAMGVPTSSFGDPEFSQGPLTALQG